MKKHIFLIVLFISQCYSQISCHNKKIAMQSYEQWWQFALNLDENPDFAGGDGESRKKVREYVATTKYTSILDIPCGRGLDYILFRKMDLTIDYIGIDITPKLVEHTKEIGLDTIQGSIEQIPMNDCAVDICYARHILEHLPYYKKAINELIRVARQEVLIVFFISPSNKPDFINPTVCDDYLLYHNYYNKEQISRFILSQQRVKRIEWESVDNTEESILHIFLKTIP